MRLPPRRVACMRSSPQREACMRLPPRLVACMRLPPRREACIIIIIIIKRGWQCKAGIERLTPYQSEDPNPTTPTHRKKEEKGKNSRRQKGSEQLGQ